MESQFLQAQKTENVSRLAGGIAHNFNNLFTAINGTAELASASLREGDPLLAHLQEIYRVGARAAEMTRELLAFSHEQVLKPEVLSLANLVADRRKLAKRLIGEDITLVVAPVKSEGRVKADPGQIEQVLMNLVINARDAMAAGGTLTIETQDVELGETNSAEGESVQPGSYVLLTASDMGVGTNEATRLRIFEPFFITKEQATGLGLSAVYGIVKQSGGGIAVDSVLERGTTFKIFLPRVAEVSHANQQTRPLLRRPQQRLKRSSSSTTRTEFAM